MSQKKGESGYHRRDSRAAEREEIKNGIKENKRTKEWEIILRNFSAEYFRY